MTPDVYFVFRLFRIFSKSVVDYKEGILLEFARVTDRFKPKFWVILSRFFLTLSCETLCAISYDRSKMTSLELWRQEKIAKNHKKSKISNKTNTVGDFHVVTTCDDTFWN